MKPIYQGCMEKGIQHVATHAAEAAIGGRTASSAMNGKVKKSWEYAQRSLQQQQQQQQLQQKNQTNSKGKTAATKTNNNNNVTQQKITRAAATASYSGGDIGDTAGKTMITQIWSRIIGASSSAQMNFAQTANAAAHQYATVTTPNGEANSSSGSNTTNINNAASNRKKRRAKKWTYCI